MEDMFKELVSEKYDVAVMYSGGKDSSFLLYYFNNILNLRTIAVMVDNGYESHYLRDHVADFPKLLNIPFKIIKPKKEFFSALFRMLVSENELFSRPGVNHVCFICNNILWAFVCKYAMENKIPYVASGLSYTQLCSGRKDDLIIDKTANAIAERSTRFIFKNAIVAAKKSKEYEDNYILSDYLTKLENSIKNVTTVYPYIYNHIPTDELKNRLTKLGWMPPKEINVDKYISSGCKILKNVVSEMEKLGMLSLNEREQAKRMVESGLANPDDLVFAEHNALEDKVDLRSPIIEELGLKEFFINKCKDREYYI